MQFLPGSSINFAIHKIKLGTFTAEVFKKIFKGTLQIFLIIDYGIPIYELIERNISILESVFEFLYDVFAMVKQLGIPEYFSAPEYFSEELPYIINKINNLRLTDEELKHLKYQERYNLLNNNSVFVARHFE